MSYEETSTIDKAKKGEKWKMWWLNGKEGSDHPARITRKVEILEDVNALMMLMILLLNINKQKMVLFTTNQTKLRQT
jgi:hypothetical protein